MVARCDAAFFGLLCPLEVGVFSVVFTPTFLAGRVWRRVLKIPLPAHRPEEGGMENCIPLPQGKPKLLPAQGRMTG